MGKTSIEWTDANWNPTRGCSRVSPGCANCYAERIAGRFAGEGEPFHGFVRLGKNGPRWTGKMELLDAKLGEPLSWREPRRIFVNSMSDLFHERLTFREIAAVFGVMVACPIHTFQILTKRADRLRYFHIWLQRRASEEHLTRAAFCALAAAESLTTASARRRAVAAVGFGPLWPLPNVWQGVSVEDQERADLRIPDLLSAPAAVRFLSCEPLLDRVSLLSVGQATAPIRTNALTGRWDVPRGRENPTSKQEPRVHWVIVGGESGPRARSLFLPNARALVEECRLTATPVFVKQLGAVAVDRLAGGASAHSFKHKKGGDMGEWPADLRLRQYPPNAPAPGGP